MLLLLLPRAHLGAHLASAFLLVVWFNIPPPPTPLKGKKKKWEFGLSVIWNFLFSGKCQVGLQMQMALRFFYKHLRPHHTSVVVPGKPGAALGWGVGAAGSLLGLWELQWDSIGAAPPGPHAQRLQQQLCIVGIHLEVGRFAGGTVGYQSLFSNDKAPVHQNWCFFVTVPPHTPTHRSLTVAILGFPQQMKPEVTQCCVFLPVHFRQRHPLRSCHVKAVLLCAASLGSDFLLPQFIL